MQSLWPLWIVLNTKSTLFEKSSCLAMSIYLLLPRRRSQKVAHLSLETSFYASLPTGFHPENLQRISCLAACLAMSLSLRSQSQHKLHFACTDRARIFCPANWLANWPPSQTREQGPGASVICPALGAAKCKERTNKRAFSREVEKLPPSKRHTAHKPTYRQSYKHTAN